MGKRFYGKFACMIGQYMEKWIFQDVHHVSLGGGHSTNFDPELRNEVKNVTNRVVHSTTFITHLELKD